MVSRVLLATALLAVNGLARVIPVSNEVGAASSALTGKLNGWDDDDDEPTGEPDEPGISTIRATWDQTPKPLPTLEEPEPEPTAEQVESMPPMKTVTVTETVSVDPTPEPLTSSTGAEVGSETETETETSSSRPTVVPSIIITEASLPVPIPTYLPTLTITVRPPKPITSTNLADSSDDSPSFSTKE
ncbi:hypothetical protein MKZ38_005835 [Zalerion maritima]|uniref:Uncharacterized protein n=1 Tax=Zalerion maritima TaxID=339359 RepID=A0AAD5RVZ4_9PEZI|nr:hypothetical protein MKZ38_005835 [Zalerion maritima]